MTLKILHVLDHSIPLHSGYTFRTLSILREQRRRGWQTFHVTSPKHHAARADEEDIDGWHFYRTRMADHAVTRVPVLRELELMRAIEQRVDRVAREVRPDAIHAHSPVLNAIPALRVARRLGIPIVYEVRAFWEDAAVDHGSAREGGLRYQATRALETYVLKRTNHVTTICEGLRSEIIGRGVSAGRVTVIPNAVDIAAFPFDQPADDALRATLGLVGKTVIGFIGSFYAYEGLDLLIEALPKVLVTHPDARLLLTGGGPQEETLKARVRALGLGDKVVFTGRVPHQDVQRYYSIVDVFAYPRHSMRLTELVTPLKPLEAMAQGRLLVASDVGGHKELIRHRETGILFEAGNVDALAQAIVQLLDARDAWPRLRSNARDFVERERNWAASVARYEPVYAQSMESMVKA